MKNFSRALRGALKFRWTMAGAFFCGLMVALLWGGNLGVVYPVVEVVFQGESPHDWIDEQVDESRKRCVAIEKEIDERAQQIDKVSDAEGRELRQLNAIAAGKLELEKKALLGYQKARPIIKDYMPTDAFSTLVLVIVVLMVGTLVKDLFLIGSMVLVDLLTQRTMLDLRQQFFERTLCLDLDTLGKNPDAELVSRFTGDMGSIGAGIQTFYGRAIREPLKMFACLALAAVICWRLLLLTMVVVPLAMWVINKLARSLRRASRRIMEETAVFYNVLTETFGGIKAVKAYTMEVYEENRFAQVARKIYRKSMKISIYNSLVRPLTELVGIVIIGLAILVGAYLVLNKQTHLFNIRISHRPLSFGALALFYTALAGVSDPARKLADVFNHLQRAMAASDRVFEFFDREPAVVEPATPVECPTHNKSVAFQDVDFHYSEGQPVLRGVSLDVHHGETIAIVGHNGCGKSTLANLLPRFFDPQKGQVLLDGVDVSAVRKRDLRNQMALVTQETSLFNDTVANNIRYGTPDASDAEVIQAAKQAHAHEFIVNHLENGYQTIVGSSGSRLSGGQRQRIALARAILRDPAILILDEATSQVDLESEHLIQKTLAEFTKGRTTFIITHRLGILAIANRIVVMEEGKIQDVGTHAELMARSKIYNGLYQSDLPNSA